MSRSELTMREVLLADMYEKGIDIIKADNARLLAERDALKAELENYRGVAMTQGAEKALEDYAILREALERIVVLKDNQSISYEKWELMVDMAVNALQRAGGGE